VHCIYSYGLVADNLPDTVRRISEIRNDDATDPGNRDGVVYAAYSYNGVGTMVVEDVIQPDVRLDYWGQTAGTYAGFDRFGRVIQQRWYDYGASAERDKYAYGYDAASNRLYRENTVTADKDEFYAYDDLDRLTTFHRGDLDGDKDEIPTADRVRGSEWTLTQTGNWSAYKIDDDGDGLYNDGGDLSQTRAHNDVNELTAVSETQGSSWADPAWSARGNMTTVPKPTSLTNSYTCTYDAWRRLVEVKSGQTTVAKYEYDALHRRVKKHIDTDAPGDPDGVDTYRHFYYNAAWQVIETRQSASENAAPQTTLQPEYQYVWSMRYIDAPVLRDENTDADDVCDDQRLYSLTSAARL